MLLGEDSSQQIPQSAAERTPKAHQVRRQEYRETDGVRNGLQDRDYEMGDKEAKDQSNNGVQTAVSPRAAHAFLKNARSLLH